MRSRRGLAFRPSWAAVVEVLTLEDRRLLSILGVSSESEALPASDGNPAVANPAVVMTANTTASQATAGSTDSSGDSRSVAVSVVYSTVTVNDGESFASPTQVKESASNLAGPAPPASASSVSDPGEIAASPIAGASPAQSATSDDGTTAVSKAVNTGLGATIPGPSTSLPQTTPTANANRLSGPASSGAGDDSSANEARTNQSSGTSPSIQSELTPFDDRVSTAAASGSAPDAFSSPALSSGTGTAPSDADSTLAGAVSARLATAPGTTVGLTANAGPVFDSPTEHATQTEGLYASPAKAAVSPVTVAANHPLSAEEHGRLEAGPLPEAEPLEMDTAVGNVEMPSPRYADLLTEFLPFDRACVEHAIDGFLDRFESLGAELTDLRETTNLVPLAAATAVTCLAVEVALRRRRAR